MKFGADRSNFLRGRFRRTLGRLAKRGKRQRQRERWIALAIFLLWMVALYLALYAAGACIGGE